MTERPREATKEAGGGRCTSVSVYVLKNDNVMRGLEANIGGARVGAGRGRNQRGGRVAQTVN